MSKKGVISLEALVKLLPHLVLVIVLLFGLTALYKIFIQEKETTQIINDLDRATAIIKQLSPGETATVFTTAKDYNLNLYSEDYKGLPEQCGGETCLCLEEAAKTTCRPLPKIGKECADVSQIQCEFEPMCFDPKDKYENVTITKRGDPVHVCRSCTKISMSDTELKCQEQVKT